MLDRVWVIDASVLAAAMFEEDDTQVARTFLTSAGDLIAPCLLATEMASIAAKKVWKGLTTVEIARQAVADTPRLIALHPTSTTLMQDALDLACAHRISAYDATYVALAVTQDVRVVTLDAKLLARLNEAGLSNKAVSLGAASRL